MESVRDHALFQVDPEGRVTFWNKGAEDLFGYGQDEILGRHVAILYTSNDQELSAEPNENERWMVRRDGARIFACGVTQPLLGSGGEVRGFVKVLRDDSERRRSEERRSRNERQEHHRVLGEVEHTEAALARTQDDLRALAARLMTAHEDERRRIARELHDDLSQRLALREMHTVQFARRPDFAEEETSEIEGIRQEVAKISEMLRNISHRLHPRYWRT